MAATYAHAGYRVKANRMPLLPLADADAIVAAAQIQPEVVAAAKRITTGGLVQHHKLIHEIQAIQPSVEQPISMQAENITAGRFLLDDDGDAVLIGKGLADELGVTAGDRVTVVGRSKQETMRQRTMTVVGIYDLGMAERKRHGLYHPARGANPLQPPATRRRR